MSQVSIPQWKIKRLIKAGEDFNVPFCLPPFDGNINEGCFDINKFKKDKKFQEFLSIIESIGIKYEYAFSKEDAKKKIKKVYMAIKTKE